jgi:hypothetical protein
MYRDNARAAFLAVMEPSAAMLHKGENRADCRAFGRPCLQPCSKAIDGSIARLEMLSESLWLFQRCSLCIVRKSCVIGLKLILRRLSPATHCWAIGMRRSFSGSRRRRRWIRKHAAAGTDAAGSGSDAVRRFPTQLALVLKAHG